MTVVIHKNEPCTVTPIFKNQIPAEPPPAETASSQDEPLTLLDQAMLGLEPRRMNPSSDIALRVLRQVCGTRPALLLPVSMNTRAAATAAVVEMRARCTAITGENEGSRPPREVADEVLRAAAPFIQRDLVNRVFADRLWMTAVVSASAVVSLAGMGAAAVWAAMYGVVWLAVVLGFAAAAVAWCTWQLAAGLRHQAGRARSIAEQPLTGQQVDESARTVDLATAQAAGR